MKGENSEEQARQALDRAMLLPIALYSIDTLVQPALTLAMQKGRSVYDSTYLALAVAQGRQVVSADLRFVKPLRSGLYGNYFVIALSDVN